MCREGQGEGHLHVVVASTAGETSGESSECLWVPRALWPGRGKRVLLCHLDEAVSQQGFHRRTERRTEPSQGLCSEHRGEFGEHSKVASFLPLLLSPSMENPGM